MHGVGGNQFSRAAHRGWNVQALSGNYRAGNPVKVK